MISTVVQRGSMIYVYGDNGALVSTQTGDLYGYTGSTVAVKRGGNTIYLYSESGTLLGTQNG